MPPAASVPAPAADTTALLGHVRLLAVAHIPDLSATPYPDALMEWLVEPIGKPTQLPPRLIVRVWGMRGHQLTETTTRRPRDSVELMLVPIDSAPDEVRQAARFTLDDPKFELIDLPIWWGMPR